MDAISIVDLTFLRTARHGQRRVVGMWRDWNALREAVALGDPVATQQLFDECEPWVDWCFGMAAERKEEQSLYSHLTARRHGCWT